MAEDVQRLLLQIDASATLLRQEVAKARNDIDGFADKGAAKLQKIDAGFAGMGNSANAATARLAGFAAGLLSVGQAASFMVRANADMQRLSAMLEVATGSAGSAASAMSELQSFAAETPFTLGQVTEAYIKLKNLGLDPSTEALRSFGNTSAAMGKDIMQFIEAVADAATGEFERLKEFGIKASKEGDKVKFTFQGVTTTVQNTAQAITAYLRGLGDESGVFAGSMAKQMDTIDGKLSNLGDAASRLATALGALGFNDFFMGQLDKAAKSFEYLERVSRGLANIRKSEGVGAMMTVSLDEAAASGTATGMRDRLARQANDAKLARIAAERARERGNLIGGGAAVIGRTRQEEREALETLTRFEKEDYMLDIVGRFPLNQRGRFGKSPLPKAASSDKKKKGKAAKDFTPANMESGFELRQLLDAGTPAKIEVTNQALQGIASTLSDLQSYDFEINIIGQEQIKLADDFTNSLSSGLAQAILNGQSLGDALLNSIKAAASELISSGLLNLLSGGKRGVSFGESISAVTSLFGGGRATGGSVMPGRAYVVGENRPELFVPSTSGYIMPRVPSGQGGGGQQSVNVTVNPSPLFITTVAQGAQAAAQETLRKSTRQRMPMSAGV
jgi:hypothetical protein